MDNRLRESASLSGSRMMHGGFAGTRALDDAERQTVDALIDTLIPPEEGWPPAVELGIADLLATYLVPAHAPVSLYPHFTRDEFPAIAGALLGGAPGAQEAARIDALRSAERDDPALFARVRDFVYYVYYGHPAVVELIRATTRYGAGYLGGPQPEGYDSSLEGWGQHRPSGRGVFIPTDRVLRAPQAKERA